MRLLDEDVLRGRIAGTEVARFVKAMGRARGDILGAVAVAEANEWQITRGVLKALTTAVTIEQNLAAMTPIAYDMTAVLRPATIVGRLQVGMRQLPFFVHDLQQQTGMTARFVGEGDPLPIGGFSVSDMVALQPRKVAGGVIMTQEVVQYAGKTDAVVAQDAAAALIRAIDTAFADPANGGTADQPASITYGASATFSSSGSTLAAIDADLARMLNAVTGANNSLVTAAWLMSATTATYLSLLRGSGGAPAFPGVTARGGELLGLPVLTSSGVSASGSPGERYIVLVEASGITYADDGQTRIDLSHQAAVEMNDAPSGGAQQLVSLWQLNLVGLRAVRYVNWHRSRPGAVAVLRDVTY